MSIYDINGNKITSESSGSPIAGQNIGMIGDSNTQYNADGFKATFEEKYGCNFYPLGYAGATWEGTSEYSAVGRVNTIINSAINGINTEYDKILIMMGTNCTTLGAVTDTSENVETMCGAIRYCLEKLLYYCRKSKIGVILPPQRLDGNDIQEDRNELIKTICDEYSIPTLDMFHGGQIVSDTKTPDGQTFYLYDGLHLGGNGGDLFMHKVGNWMAYVL